jgi:hypothetical protein
MYEEMYVMLGLLLHDPRGYTIEEGEIRISDPEVLNSYNESARRYQALYVKRLQIRSDRTEFRRGYEAGAVRLMEECSPLGSLLPAPTNQIQITLDHWNARINGAPISFPMPLESLIKVIGPPDRINPSGRIRTWDALGILAFSDPGVESIHALGFTLNPDASEGAPTNLFQGTIVMNGVAVNETDTPRSLNRRLKGPRFKQTSPTDAGWTAKLSGYSVYMDRGTNGVSSLIGIEE